MKHGIAEYNGENAKTENGIAAFLYAIMEMAVEEANRDQSFNKCRRQFAMRNRRFKAKADAVHTIETFSVIFLPLFQGAWYIVVRYG